MPAGEPLAEQFGHAGLLAQPLQAAGGADGEEWAGDVAENARGPGGVGEKPLAKPEIADDHDADAGDQQDQRAADADDRFARHAAAERLARNVAERLHHQEQQRHDRRHQQ